MMRFRWCGFFSYCFNGNFPESVSVKEFKNWSIIIGDVMTKNQWCTVWLAVYLCYVKLRKNVIFGALICTHYKVAYKISFYKLRYGILCHREDSGRDVGPSAMWRQFFCCNTVNTDTHILSFMHLQFAHFLPAFIVRFYRFYQFF